MLNQKEREILRQLAKEYAEIAALPAQKEKKALWLKTNTLQMERPMLLIDQIPWNEMDLDGSLCCRVQDAYWQGVENELRQTLYKWRHMPADMVVNPYIALPRPIENSGWGLEVISDVIELEKHATANSYRYTNQIQSMEDVERIQMPRITLDAEKEAEIIAQAHELFDGIIDFKMTGKCLHLGIWDTIAMWMGVENCYFALLDEPEMIHALMEKLTQGLISMTEQLNALNTIDIHSHLCHCSQTFLPDLEKEEKGAISGNGWAFGLAQLFTSCSPAITDEFEVQYMQRVFPHFGAIYYGCCDRLDDRMDVIRKLPNIRKLSCSPWSEREAFSEKMPDFCVMSNKPNPAFLASGQLDEDQVRKDIRRTISAAKAHGRSLEIILKDISTVSHNPHCLFRWHDIVMEEICR